MDNANDQVTQSLQSFCRSGFLAAIRAGGRRSYSLMQDLTIGEFQKYIELRSTFLFSQGESPSGETR